MDNSFWYEIWLNDETHFHKVETNEYLLQFHHVLGDLKNKTVFVPLCGKSLDLLWFYNQGANVIGAELSDRAIESFFAEHQLDYQKTDETSFSIYEHDKIKIICGDLFQLSSQQVQADVIYDRAALVALPEELRERYVQKMVELSKPESQTLLITMSFQSPNDGKPPFTITEEQVQNLYGDHFDIERLYHNKNAVIPPHLHERGFSNLDDWVFLLTKR